MWTRYLEVAPKRDSSKSDIFVRINAVAFLTVRIHQECVVEQIELNNITYRVLSSVSIDEFFEFFTLEKSGEIESTTVNGWLSEVCGNIPDVGFSFGYENLSISVTQADEQKTHEISVKVIPVTEEETAAQDAEAVESK